MPFPSIKPAKSIRGEVSLQGDKSIAHRSIFLSAIAKGNTEICRFPVNEDCSVTVNAFKKLGVKISVIKKGESGINLYVEGRGLSGLTFKTGGAIFMGESGTTYRLLLGLLSGQPFTTTLTAADSLSGRPMRRITLPLRKMGAQIKAQNKNKKKGVVEEYPPITVSGGRLKSIYYKMPLASAQVKSALLLAGLYAEGTTKILEPLKTRDHTERMLKDFGADIRIKNKTIFLKGKQELYSPGRIDVPADISSAAFFIVAAILLPGSYLTIKSVGVNPGRSGIIRVLKRMGADINLVPSEAFVSGSEPSADIIVKSSQLKGVVITKSEIPQLIDELPVIILASCFAEGRTIINGVEELRVKETDRVSSMQENLRKMGAKIDVLSNKGSSGEKMVIEGVGRLQGARVESFGDHRTAMSMIIAGLLCRGRIFIDEVSCISKSFPDFLEVLKRVVK